MQISATTTSKISRGIAIAKRIGTCVLYSVGLTIMTIMFGIGLVGSIENGVLLAHVLYAAPFLVFLPALVLFGRTLRKARANNQTPSPEFLALGVVLAILSACGLMLVFFSAIIILPAIMITCGATGIYIARKLATTTRIERKAC